MVQKSNTDCVFPRVLILIQPFNHKAGGGITLSNLFKGWPKDRLAVAALGSLVDSHTSFDVCDNYYVLGSQEQKWKFPLNLVMRRIQSGPLHPKLESISSDRLPAKNVQRAKVFSNLVVPFLSFLGLYELVQEIKASDSLQRWIADFKPDLIYAQAHTRQRVLFCTEVQRLTGLPMAFHMMDDWLGLVKHESLFGSFWERKSTKDFVEMLGCSALHLSISDGMGTEYRRRYGFEFNTFHNPIDLEFWRKGQKIEYRLGQPAEVLYAGRVGLGINNSLELMAKVIDLVNLEGNFSVKFVLQVPEFTSWMGNYSCIEYREPVPYSELPIRFGQADILYLPYDFSAKSLSFIRYSMPTKASEYMISGTPILILAPSDTALSEYARSHQWAMVSDKNDVSSLKNALLAFLENREFRETIAANAIKAAEERHDASKVREQFRAALAGLMQSDPEGIEVD